MNEQLEAERWLVHTLEADSTIAAAVSGAYNEFIPQDKTLPAIRFSIQYPEDVMGIGTNRILVKLDYLVVCTYKNTALTAGQVAIANQIDTVLHGAQGTSNNLIIVACFRLSTFKNHETVDGASYFHAGGTYRIVCHKA